uniref:Uncharacterized protein n=1 Tax=Sparus aurata TaxID=8175 RepID=A0A671YVF6_SPAAU
SVILKMRVSVSLVFATLLCFTTWMNTHTPLVMCCAYWSKTKIPLTRIANYTIQSEVVLIFYNVNCTMSQLRTNIDIGWAKKAKLKVDKEERKNKLPENGQNDEGATSNITPATVTTSTYTMQRRRAEGSIGGHRTSNGHHVNIHNAEVRPVKEETTGGKHHA